MLAEFNPNANDDFSGSERPAAVGSEECVTEPQGTLLNGPVHDPLEDLSLGVEFTVKRVAGNNRWVVIGVRAARADNTP